MSPLKIMMLLRLYAYSDPFDDMPYEQRIAPAMLEAFDYFSEYGLLAPGITHERVLSNRYSTEALSEKGLELVERLCAVEPLTVPRQREHSANITAIYRAVIDAARSKK